MEAGGAGSNAVLPGAAKEGKKKRALSTENLIAQYKRLCYIYGRHLDTEENPEISRVLYQADVEMTPGLFISLMTVSAFLAAIISFIAALLIFSAPFSPFATDTPWMYVILLTVVSTAVVGGGFPFYLQNQVSNKKMDIERNLPYAMAFMSILASSGATPLDIIKRIAEEDYGHISREFSKVLFRIEILGEDAVTAMNALVNSTPSEIFRDITIDLTNLIYGGSGLASYLASKSKDLMKLRRQTDKEFVESLGVYGETYLGGVVMTLTLAVLGIVISGALGIELGPLEPDQMFKALIYLIIPVINIIFLAMLEVKYSSNP